MPRLHALGFFVIALTQALLFEARYAAADEKLKDIACRSVHLSFPTQSPVQGFYNEVTVKESAPGTYFMVCGWQKGYFGLQELGDGRKLLIFSVWDSTATDDPQKVDPSKRVKLVDQDPKTRIGRFGGEGTGGQSFYDYDWKLGDTYRFMVTSAVEDDRTAYSGWFYLPEEKVWKKLVTFSTITKGQSMTGLYSFVEDFKRNRISAQQVRRAEYGNAWSKDLDGKWQALRRAKFTADANPVVNIDAGSEKDRFFLATGGNTQNQTTQLRELMSLPALPEGTPPPSDLPL